MKIEEEQQIAAAELVDKHTAAKLVDQSYCRGLLTGGLIVMAGMTPPFLMLGYRASVNPAVNVGYLATEAALLAASVTGARMWLRRERRRQWVQAQPRP